MIDQIKHELQKEKWVSYPKAMEIIGVLQDLIDHPTVSRPPNILLFGATNNGKSALLRKFMEKYPPVINPLEDYKQIPVIYIQCDTGPDEKKLYGSINQALGIALRSYTNTSTLKIQTIHILKKVGCRLLIIDEIQHVLFNAPAKQRVLMDTIKYLSNELKISIVLGGTEEAVRTLSSKQLANRFEPIELPEWKLNVDYATLFVSLMDHFLVADKKFTFDKEFIKEVYFMSEGNLGATVEIIRKTCLKAYESNTMDLSNDLLKMIRYTNPDKVRSIV